MSLYIETATEKKLLLKIRVDKFGKYRSLLDTFQLQQLVSLSVVLKQIYVIRTLLKRGSLIVILTWDIFHIGCNTSIK